MLEEDAHGTDDGAVRSDAATSSPHWSAAVTRAGSIARVVANLAEFAKIVETFDHPGESFVSGTRAFNTTNSVGRLTMSVLLSFAQFRREVTGECIREEMAAFKATAKGVWMGGNQLRGRDPPVDQVARTIAVNPAETEKVRQPLGVSLTRVYSAGF